MLKVSDLLKAVLAYERQTRPDREMKFGDKARLQQEADLMRRIAASKNILRKAVGRDVARLIDWEE